MVRMKRNLKRFVCLCLAAVMLLGMMPGTAFGEGGGGGTNGSTEGWTGGSGPQTIWVSNGAKQFVRVTLVELPDASATDLSNVKVINSMVIHNGLPTAANNVVMVGNNAIDYAKGQMNTTSTTAQALMDSGALFMNWTEEPTYAASGLSDNSKTRPGLRWFSVGGDYGVSDAWAAAPSSLTAFHAEAIDNGKKVFVPTPFLETVLGKLFGSDSDFSDVDEEVIATLARRLGIGVDEAKTKWKYTIKFLSPANAQSGAIKVLKDENGLLTGKTSMENANVDRYRLLVEPGIFVKNGSNGSLTGTYVGYTAREGAMIYQGKIPSINSNYAVCKQSMLPWLGMSFFLDINEWYDMYVDPDTDNYADYTFKDGGFLTAPPTRPKDSQLVINALEAGQGLGISILTPYDFSSPSPSNSSSSVTLKIKKIVDGDSSDDYYPFYGVVDARKFAANLKANLPAGVTLKSITMDKAGESNAQHVLVYDNTEGGTLNAETHDPSLPSGSPTLMWFFGIAQNGGELSYKVSWNFEYDRNKFTDDMIEDIARPYIEDITLFAVEQPVWKEGTTSADDGNLYVGGTAERAVQNKHCGSDSFPAPGISTNTTVDSPTDSLVGAFDDAEWGSFGNGVKDFGTDKNGVDMVDSKSDIVTEGAMPWGSVAGTGMPAGVIHAEIGETVAELDFHNSLGFRFRKKLGVGEDSTSVDPNTEFEFKITSIKDNGAELDGSTVISYAKDAWMDTPGETQSKTYDELKNETLTASSNHGYTFFVPSTYEITIEELDDHGMGVTMFYSPGDDESGWTKLGDGPEGVINSEHPDITFYNGELGGNCHVIIDYNLNGMAATAFHRNDTCVMINGPDTKPVECGTATAGELIKATLNTEIKQEMVLHEADGFKITAKFLGIWDTPAEGGKQLAGPEAIANGFEYTVPASTPNDHLIVLYARWEFECDGEPPEGEDGGELYWIVFDHNYTGGPIITEAVGEIQMSGGEGDDEEEEEFVPCECGCVDPVVCTGGEDCTCCADGTKCCDACTCKPPAGDDEGDEDDGDGEGGGGTIKLGFYDPYEHIKDSIEDRESMRTGWLFCGWSHEADEPNGLPTDPETGDTDTSYRGFEEDFMPEESATYYGIWFAKDIMWDANGGTIDGAAQYTQPGKIYMAADRVPAEVSVPVRTGYHFNGWFWDKECMNPIQEFESGVQPGQTYYAGWVADPVYVYYYDVRENTTLIGKQEYEYGDTFSILAPYNGTDGQRFQNWAVAGTGVDAAGLTVLDDTVLTYHERGAGEDGNPVWGNGYWELNINAVWQKTTASFNAIINWADYSNNDRARPKSVEVGLLSSLNNKTEQTATITGGETANTWQYTFTGLDITTSETSVEEITYSIYLKGYTDVDDKYHEIIDTGSTFGEISVATQSNADTAVYTSYRYGVNNYMTDDQSYADGFVDNEGEQLQENNRIYAGKISFNHDLITTGDDIQFTIEWLDDTDNDGIRPGAVQLTLYANGQPVSGYPLHNAYTGFVSVSQGMCDVSNDGNTWTYTFRDYQKFDQGKPIDYTVGISPVSGYDTWYLNGTDSDANGVRMYHAIEQKDKIVTIRWDDELNRDGIRPDIVRVQLSAYQYNRLTNSWEQRIIESHDVTGGMTDEYWYDTFEGCKVYEDGEEIRYFVDVITDLNSHIPELHYEYGWTASDMQIVIHHNRSVKDVIATIDWADSHNNDNIRPSAVLLRLWADGVLCDGEFEFAVIEGDEWANTWKHTFKNMPIYREGKVGEEIIYTITVEEIHDDTIYGEFLTTANGYEEWVTRYVDYYQTHDGFTTTNHLESGRPYVRLAHDIEQGSVNLAVSWHDEENRDGMRPSSVLVDLYKQVDGVRQFVQTVTIVSGASGQWSYRIKGLPMYEDGKPVMYVAEVSPDSRNQVLTQNGYTCSMEGTTVHMYYTPKTGSVTAQVHWIDKNDNDSIRPDHVVGALYANGLAVAETTIEFNELNNWTHTWENLPMYYLDRSGNSQPVVYTVQIKTPDGYELEYIPESTTLVRPEKIYINLTHEIQQTTVPFDVYWNDNGNNDNKRPSSVQVQLYANGEPVVGQIQTVTGDMHADVWHGVFEGDLPEYDGGSKIYYTVQVISFVQQYNIMTAGMNVYFSYDAKLADLYVSLRFDDNFNADGVRPTGGYITLMADGNVVNEADYEHTTYVDADGLVNDYFYGLPVFAMDGKKIQYNVVISFDDKIFGGDSSQYSWDTSKDITLSETNANQNQLVIRLEKSQDMGTQTGHVYWFDNNDTRGNRPRELTINVYDDVNPYSVGQYTLHLDNKTDETGVVLDADGNHVGTVTVEQWGRDNDASKWTYTINDLPSKGVYVNAAGNHVSYRIRYYAVANIASIANYYNKLDGKEYGLDITLTHKHYETDTAAAYQNFTVIINWVDNSNKWGFRPDTTGVQIVLKANGETYQTVPVTGNNVMAGNPNAWQYEFENLPTYKGGQGVVWSAEIIQGDGYTTYTVQPGLDERETTTISMVQTVGFNFKVYWTDDNNNDRVRPSAITLVIRGDGSEVGRVIFEADPDNEDEYYAASIDELPVWRVVGGQSPINYTFAWAAETQQTLDDNLYSPAIRDDGRWYYLSTNAWGDSEDEGRDQFTGQYEWSTELVRSKETINVVGSIEFDDAGDQDGKRPDSVQVQLYGNGEPVGDPVTVTPDELGNWSYVWPDMDRLSKGEPIEYTIKLVYPVPGYDAFEDGLNIRLYHEPETVTVSVIMAWNDDSEVHYVYNADGKLIRAYGQIPRIDIGIHLFSDGTAVSDNGYKVIPSTAYGTGERLSTKYTVVWEDMPKYRDHGQEITYTFGVERTDALNGMLANGRYELSEDQSKMTAKIERKLFDVSGKVYYLYNMSDEFLLADATVSVYAYNEATGKYACVGSAVTNENGEYFIQNVPNGILLVRATWTYMGRTMAGMVPVKIDRHDNTADIVIDRDASADDSQYTYTAEGNAYYQTDITDESTKHPVPAGSIALLYKITDGQSDAVYTAMAVIDENGHYRFDDLSTGGYIVNVIFNYNGGVYTYDNEDAVADGLNFNIGSASCIWNDIVKQVNADVTPDDPSVTPDPKPVDPEEGPQACVLNGYVFFSDNGVHTTDPVEGVDVYLYQADTQAEAGKTVTDENGHWTLDGVPAGDYIAVFSYQGSTSRVLTFTVTDEEFEAGERDVATQYFDRTTKDPVGIIRGVVLKEDGKRESALVQIIDSDGKVIAFTYTDVNGMYSFTVPAGRTYRVQILQVGVRTEELTAGNPDDERTTLDYYQISGNFSRDGVNVEGAVVNIAKRDDSIRDEDKWAVKAVTLTNEKGDWTAKVTEGGNYRVTTYLHGELHETRYFTVGYKSSEPMVAANADGTYRVSGREQYKMLTLYNHTGSIVTIVGEINSEGINYDFNSLPAGTYEIRLVTAEGREKWYYFDAPNTGIDVKYFVTVSGIALDSHGRPAVGAIIRLLDKDGSQVGSDIVTGNGSYGWSGVLGSYNTSTNVGDYIVQIDYPVIGQTLADKTTEEPDSYELSYPDGMPDGSVWTWNINAHVVSGTVTDQNGLPIPGATVVIRDKDNPDVAISTVTDENGNFSVGVPNGRFEIQAIVESDGIHTYPSEKQDIVVDGDLPGVNLIVNRYTVIVTVVRETDNKPVANADVEIKLGSLVYASGKTDENGQLSVPGVLPDNYMAVVTYGPVTGSAPFAVFTSDTKVTVKLPVVTTLYGTVYDPDGIRAPDAIIHYNGPTSGQVYTNDEGNYELILGGGELGLYEIWAEAGGHKSSLTTVNVTTDVRRDILLQRTEITGTPHRITGVVTDNSGHRLANAVVTLVYGNDKTNVLTTSTNSNGEYRFTVPDGTYYLTAAYTSDTGYTYQTNGETVTHVDGADKSDVNLAITLAYEVTIKVFDTEWNIIRDALASWLGASSGMIEVGPSGMVKIMLAGGLYDSIKVTSGIRSAIKTLVEIKQATVLEFLLEMPGLAENPPTVSDTDLTISGYVHDADGKPVQGATVVLKWMDEETLTWHEIKTTLSGANGYYEFTGLPAGRYTVEITYETDHVVDTVVSGNRIDGYAFDKNGNPYVGATVNLYKEAGTKVATVYTNGSGYYEFTGLPEGAYRVEIIPVNDEGENTTQSWVTAEPNDATIEGIVLDAAGRPVEGATVTITGPNGFTLTMITDATGEYSFDVPYDGEYQIHIVHPNSYVVDTDDVKTDPDDPDYPTVNEDGYVISGVVTDTDGNPVTDGTVIVILRDKDGNELDQTKADENGEYEFTGLRPGQYEVVVIWGDNQKVYVVETGTGIVTPKPDEKPDPTPPGKMTIAGTVTASHGRPLQGAVVTIRNADTGETFNVIADKDGKFQTPEISTGRYEVYADYTHEYGTNRSDTVIVTETRNDLSLVIVPSYRADVNGDGKEEDVFAGEDDLFDTADDFYEADVGNDGVIDKIYAGADGKPGTADDWYAYDVNGDGKQESVYVGPDRIPGTADDWYAYDVDKDGKFEHIMAGPDGIPGNGDDRYLYDVDGDGNPETIYVGPDGKPGTDDDWYSKNVNGEDRVIHVGTDGIPGTRDDYYDYFIDGDDIPEHILAGPDGIHGTEDDYYLYDVDKDGTDEIIHVGPDTKPGTEDDWYDYDVDGDGDPEQVFVGKDKIPGTFDDWYYHDVDGDGEDDPIYSGADGIPGTFDGFYYKDVNGDGKDDQVFVGPDGQPGTDDDYYIDDEGNMIPAGIWIRFVGNGGAIDGASAYSVRLEALEEVPTPTRVNYVFNGWFTMPSGGSRVSASQIRQIKQDVTLYAQWLRISVNVPFDPPVDPDIPGWDIDIDDPDTPLAGFVTIHFDTDGGSDIMDTVLTIGDVLTKPEDPIKLGYKLTGWKLNGEFYDFTAKVEEEMTLTAVWEYVGLLTQEHIAYIAGDDRGYVNPNKNMTRAEAAMMFYRLLTDEARNEYRTTYHQFSDVALGSWYEMPIATLASMGILKGVGDSKFNPNAPITRAEFAAIAARFDSLEDGDMVFWDVSAAHWAYDYIRSAAAKGWVYGYGDGRFGPDENITRAEVFTLVNRVLGRDTVTQDSMMVGMVTWPDNQNPNAWYYLAVQEATNGHNCDMDGISEKWTELVPTDFSKF